MGERVTVYDEHEGFAWGQLERRRLCRLPLERGARRPAEPRADAPGRGAAHLRLSGAEPEAAAASPSQPRRRRRRRSAARASGPASATRRLRLRRPSRAARRRMSRTSSPSPSASSARPTCGAARRASASTARASSSSRSPRPASRRRATPTCRSRRSASPSRSRRISRACARGDLIFWKGHIGVMLDAARLLHANGHHMAVAIEPLAEAEERIRLKSFGPIVAVKRLPALGGSDLTSGVVPDGQSPIRNP